MQRTLKICLAAILLAGTADAIGVEKRGRGGRGGRGRGGRKGTCEDSRTNTIARFDEDCADAADPTACATAVQALEDNPDFANCTELDTASEAYKTAREAVTDDEQTAIDAAAEAAKPALEAAIEAAHDAFEAAVDEERPEGLKTARDALEALKDAYKLAVECTKCQVYDDLTCDAACP